MTGTADADPTADGRDWQLHSPANQLKRFTRSYKACLNEDKHVTVYRDSHTETGIDYDFTSRSIVNQGEDHADERDNDDSNATSPSPAREQPQDLNRSLMKTLLTNGNDALSLLSRAAVQQSVNDQDNQGPTPHDPNAGENTATPASIARHMSYGVSPSSARQDAPVSRETYKLWKSCKFVKMGWMTAEDAVRFYENMAPFTPTVPLIYADHAMHRALLTSEPLLCCTILMVSSRYHSPKGPGAATRGYFAHEKLWEYFQSMVMRLVLGQERGSSSKLRTIGSIHALALAIEWHSRTLYFPPDALGWDADLIDLSNEGREANQPRNEASRWLRTVRDSVQRSDRMSLMLVGSALTLAHELGVFNDEEEGDDSAKNAEIFLSKLRARRLLFVFANQLASRLGCTSMLPQGFDQKRCRISQGVATKNRVDTFVEAMIDLTKLVRSMCELVFPSKSVTLQLLQSGRYVSLIEHFLPLLGQWHETHLKTTEPDTLQNTLFIEYQYVRIFINSVGMQAVCDRATGSSSAENPSGMPALIDSEDRGYIEEVIAGCFDLLERVNGVFGPSETFLYAPVRVILRVTSSSMFLMKALAIGSRQSQLRAAVDVLEQTVQTLRRNILDDMHLSDSFAALLELHIGRLRKSAAAAAAAGQAKLPNNLLNPSSFMTPQPEAADSGGSMAPQQQQQQQQQGGMGSRNDLDLTADGGAAVDFGNWDDFSLMFSDPFTDGWPTMPTNPTLSSLLHSSGMFATDNDIHV